MTDVLLYWRDYRRNSEHPTSEWNTNSRLLAGLQPGDRLWFITSGKNLRLDPEQAGFLVAVWSVQEVKDNPGNNPAYSGSDYHYRVIANAAEVVTFQEPVLVDHLVRPPGRDKAVPIGLYLQGPRKLTEEKARLLRASAGGELAHKWLTGSKT